MGKTSDDSSNTDRSRSWARAIAWDKSASAKKQAPILPTTQESRRAEKDVDDTSPRSATGSLQHTGSSSSNPSAFKNNVPDATSTARPAAAPPPSNAQDEGEKSTALDRDKTTKEPKSPLSKRAKAGTIRFGRHTKDALLHSWINVLLIFVPIGIAANFAKLGPGIVFAMNAIAVVPLAGMLAFATESVASRLGDTLGALLNVSFGNAVELIIFIALVKNEIRIVQASLLGSILANLLLILGMAFAAGGLRYREQIYNSTVTQMSAVMLSLSVMSLLLPTAFHASFSSTEEADKNTLRISRGTSVVLLLVYILFLVFQLKSHAYLYASMPQERIDEESHPGVLADILDSSSSSSSSDTSDTDSDGTSGSHTTAKRIKRFIRNRRKSSASSVETTSLPSHLSSPASEPHQSCFDDPNVQSRRPSVPGIPLPDILSGDEGDTETRDFQEKQIGESSRSPERKHKKKHRKHKKKRSKKNEAEDTVPELLEKELVDSQTTVVEQPVPRVGFVEDVPAREGTPNSRKLPLPFTRPALPKLLSQNVFVDPQPSGSPALKPSVSRSSAPGLRRTNSLPDRLNEGRPTPGARPLPPFVARATIAPKTRRAANGDSDEDEEEGHGEVMSRTSAVMMLLITTGLVALCAEFLVDAIPKMTEQSSVSQAFIGLIILPIVGNAAEHVSAVTVAAKNKMDLAIGIAVGSSIQIALFVTPLVVILGWCMNKNMSLYFNLFETVSLFATAFVVNFLVLDGRSNYLEGTLLIAAYIIIAVAAFFYPDSTQQSSLGGSETHNNATQKMAMMMARDVLTKLF